MKTGNESAKENYLNFNPFIKHVMRINPRKALKETAIAAALLVLTFVPFLNALKSREFDGDENYWFHSSKYFKFLFLDRNIHNPHWKDRLAYEQPPVEKYIIGFTIWITGHRFSELGPLGDSRFWKIVDRSLYSHYGAGTIRPPADLLRCVRIVMLLFGWFTCVVMYWIGKEIRGTLMGMTAALLLAYNPLMGRYSVKAMADAPVVFFMTLALVTTLYFYRNVLAQRLRAVFMYAGLIGMEVALAAGIKPSGGLVEIAFLVFCLLICGSRAVRLSGIAAITEDREIKIALSGLLISGATAMFIFVLINPYLYDQPFHGLVTMVTHRMNEVSKERLWFGGALISLPEKFMYVMRIALSPRHYGVLGTIVKFPLDAVLFTMGFVMLLFAEARSLRKGGNVSSKSILLVWIAVMISGTIIWIPIQWERYCLPVIPFIALIIGYCMDVSVGKIRDRFIFPTHDLPKGVRASWKRLP